MMEHKMAQCEGCGKIFDPADLPEGKIGYHRWSASGQINVWSSKGFVSHSEEECIAQMADWNRKQDEFLERQAQVRQEREADEQRLVEACGADDLLRMLLMNNNTALARKRIPQIAADLTLSWETLTQHSSYWSEELRRRCFAAAGYTGDDTN